MVSFILGAAAGCLITCWAYHKFTGPLVRQAERVTVVWTRCEGVPIGPEISKLATLAYLRRVL